MPSFRNKDEASRRQAERELMESTMGMLGVSGPVKPKPPPTSTSTLPKGWQPGHQQHKPSGGPGGGRQGPRSPGPRSPGGPRSPIRSGGFRSPGGPRGSPGGPRSPGGSRSPDPRSSGPRYPGPPQSPGGPRSPPGLSDPLSVRFQNGNKPRISSLSSSNPDNLSSPLSQRSGVSWAPSTSPASTASPRSPVSPNQSMNMMHQKFGTWAPSSSPPKKSPQTFNSPPAARVAPVSRKQAPTSFASPPVKKPPLKLDKPPKKKKTKQKQTTSSQKSNASYKTLDKNTDAEKPTCVQRHKCLIVIILFVICFIAAIIVFAIGASGVGGINFFSSQTGTFIPVKDGNCSYVCENNSTYPRPPLVVLALDGFRYSYLETFAEEMPHLQTIAECGVKAKMLASFPATTSPNLWTIVSGYYPQFHGIVSDWIMDYKTGEEFDPRVNPDGEGVRDAGWFHDKAIWEIARKRGKITASQQWIGDMLGKVKDDHHVGKFVDRSPTYVDEFDRSRNYTLRMDQIVEWLYLPIAERPELITVYFENPGTLGRQHGAESNEVRSVLQEIDNAIGYLRNKLIDNDALGCVNIMIVSTSGLQDTDCNRVYYLTNDIDPDEVQEDFILSPSYLGSMARITPREHEVEGSPVKVSPADEELMLNTPVKIIDHLQCSVNGGQAYLTDFLPYRLHGAYGHHLEEALVLMDDGWSFAKQRSGYDPENCRGANDGYDPFSRDMKGVFLGHGKDFKIGKSISPFQNIEIFNLMIDLLGVSPLYDEPPSDGTKGFLHNALKSASHLATDSWHLIGATDRRCQFPVTRRPDVTQCSCTAQELNKDPAEAQVWIALSLSIVLVTAVKDVVPDVPMPRKMYQAVDAMDRRQVQKRQEVKSMFAERWKGNSLLKEYSVLDLAGTQGLSFDKIDENLNGEPEIALHAPYGIPGVRDDVNENGEFFCHLFQENYMTSFDRFLKMPTAVSFTLSSNTRSRNTNIRTTCIRHDPRLDAESTPKCSDYTSDLENYHDIVMNLLYQPSLGPGVNTLFDSQITSNIVPQYREFKNEIWDKMYNEFQGWARNSEQVNIIVGPAYDMDRNSRKDSYYKLAESVLWVGDTPIPTHYYVVGIRCQRGVNVEDGTSLKGCKPEELQFIAYIFAHVKEVSACFNFGKYLRHNLATLRDVERLTGLVFLPDLSMDEETRLQMIRLKAQYPYNSDWASLPHLDEGDEEHH